MFVIIYTIWFHGKNRHLILSQILSTRHTRSAFILQAWMNSYGVIAILLFHRHDKRLNEMVMRFHICQMNHHGKFNERATKTLTTSLLTSHRIELLILGLSWWYEIRYKTGYIFLSIILLEYLGKSVRMELVIIDWLFRTLLVLACNCNGNHLDCSLLSRYSHHIWLSQSCNHSIGQLSAITSAKMK